MNKSIIFIWEVIRLSETQVQLDTQKNIQWKAGIIGSLVGGLVFGAMMAMMGMLPMVAGLIGSESSGVGFFVHMVISFLFGITFAVFTRITKWNGLVSGVTFGVLLWFLFPFILMPVMMGMTEMAFQLTSDSMMSLVGHIVYGLITGLVYKTMVK
jgi:uncharacterized membrane protein YagU involved in acid resistance